jgi:hypothetical protein
MALFSGRLLLSIPIAGCTTVVALALSFVANGLVANRAMAQTAIEQLAPTGMEQLTPVAEVSHEGIAAAPGMSQVTSVSQLTDVKPTDWAFQALQSLVERYGCIVGYPDRTYRGNRAITRYEFAAGLNACLDKIQELIAAATADFVKKEDLEVVKKLQEEFAAELATLRGRVDALEVRTATLEKQQFSTTTKLTGEMFFNFTAAGASSDVLAERSAVPALTNNSNVAPGRLANGQTTRSLRSAPEATLSYYTFLNLVTSFTGRDQLVTQLVSGNGSSPANQYVSSGFFNSWGTPFTDQTGVVNAGSVSIRELSYTFPVGKQLRIAVGPRLNYYKYFDQNRFTFYLTGAGSFNSSGSTILNAVDRGSGAAAILTLSPQFRFTAAYMAESTEFLNPALGFNGPSDPSRGLFKSTNTISTQLDFTPTRNFTLRLIYAFSNLKPSAAGFVGGGTGEPIPYGFIDDGFGGRVFDSPAHAFVANFDWLITKSFGIFGRYGYGITDVNPRNPARSGGDVRVQTFQVGLGFPDLGKKGALAVLSFLVPHDYIDGRRFLRSGGGDGATQYEFEASYYYPITDNLALVPAVYAIVNPNNFDGNPTVFVGNLRAQFRF